MSDLKQELHGYILNEFLPGEAPAHLTESTPLITGGILDSISTLKLVLHLEDKYGVRMEAHEANVDHLDTIGDIAAFVRSRS